ncbi:MAG: hydrogenase maturation protease [bacterium]
MTSDCLKTLTEALAGASRIAILGVGSDLRGDDGAGVEVAARLARTLAGRKDAKVFHGHTAPENLSGAIKEFKPSHLVVVDAARLTDRPGRVALLRGEDVGGVSFCTHALPLSVMFAYLQQALEGLKVVVIGIEPADTTFGRPLSEAVAAAVESVARDVAAAVGEALRSRGDQA